MSTTDDTTQPNDEPASKTEPAARLERLEDRVDDLENELEFWKQSYFELEALVTGDFSIGVAENEVPDGILSHLLELQDDEIDPESVECLEERVSALEGATGINLANAEYKTLSRAAKLKQIREKLTKKAEDDPRGKAAMDYNDIMWLFDGHPSPGHASELTKAAAGYDEETGQSTREGFDYQKHEDRNNRVVVDLKKLP